MIDWKTLKEKYAEFRQWQKIPHTVAPMPDVEHDCCTCGTHFTGNYCPRCGQSARIGRFSFKSALLLYVDVWGLGNRGMFRNIRDLILRPGYMIRDYLSGMQMAYFPPFKMFFLLATLSFLISSGLNIKFENKLATDTSSDTSDIRIESTDSIANVDSHSTAIAKDTEGKLSSEEEMKAEKLKKSGERIKALGRYLTEFQRKFPNIFALFWLMVFSAFLYIFFRKCPAYPGMRFSELVVALVYTSNMYSIYSNVSDFLCISSSGLSAMLFLLNLVPLHQLSGYSWKRLIFITIIALVMLAAAMAAIIILGVLVAYLI
ncbi:MAG: DUF3667 domain-containing protein [Prevotella sp.]|nr:DUF3667 domain-containing protein [Prevotella sp.]